MCCAYTIGFLYRVYVHFMPVTKCKVKDTHTLSDTHAAYIIWHWNRWNGALDFFLQLALDYWKLICPKKSWHVIYHFIDKTCQELSIIGSTPDTPGVEKGKYFKLRKYKCFNVEENMKMSTKYRNIIILTQDKQCHAIKVFFRYAKTFL